jgi:hypothetical protein
VTPSFQAISFSHRRSFAMVLVDLLGHSLDAHHLTCRLLGDIRHRHQHVNCLYPSTKQCRAPIRAKCRAQTTRQISSLWQVRRRRKAGLERLSTAEVSLKMQAGLRAIKNRCRQLKERSHHWTLQCAMVSSPPVQARSKFGVFTSDGLEQFY